MPAPMTRAEREAFLAGLHVGLVAVNEAKQGPLVVPVWYSYEPGGEIVVVTRPQARKAGLLVPGARVAFCAQTEERNEQHRSEKQSRDWRDPRAHLRATLRARGTQSQRLAR